MNQGIETYLLPDGGNLHDEQIEETVLGTMMSIHGCLHEALELLTAECFYSSRNREIFEAVKELYTKGNLPDPLLVGDALARKGSEITTGDILRISAENQVLPDVESHCRILLDLSLRRKLWDTAYRMLTACVDKGRGIEEIHSEAKAGIDTLFEHMDGGLITMEETYRSLQEDMLVKHSNPGVLTGTPTGFKELDENGGLQGSDLIVVGAETSQGKTSFATALAMSAIVNGEHVAFYSMEMTPKQLTARIASMRSGISSTRIQYQSMTMDEIYRVDKAMEGVDCSLMHFDGHSTSSLDRILMSIRNMRHRYGIKGAVVDYLQLITLGDKGTSPEQTAARCARDLKNLAKELDIWIIAISQLSRNQQNSVPLLSRLRNSGQIEEAADNIVLIYRPKRGNNYPEPFMQVSTEGTAMVSIAKGRNVGQREFICGFNGENTLFYPLENIQLSVPQKPEIDNEAPF